MKFLNEQEKEDVVKQYKDGVELHVIMKNIGCHSRNVIYKLLHKFGIPLRKPVSTREFFKKGDKINSWTITDNIPIKKKKTDQTLFWKVKCDCGTESEVAGYRLRNEDSKSCIKCSRFNRENPLGLEGTEIDKWKIIKFVGRNNDNGYIFECSCKRCGLIRTFSKHAIQTNKVPTCPQCTPHFHEDTVICQFWRRVANTASRCNREFKVRLDFALNLLKNQENKCALTDLPISFAKTWKEKVKTTASLDRIDSSIDYSEDNVQWVHKDVNRMKLEFSVKYLRYLCTLIYLKAQNENSDYSI